MDSFTKLSALLLVLILSFSSSFHITFVCGVCPTTSTPTPAPTLPPVIGNPPITLPPTIGKPPITLPPVIGKPPITLPPIIGKPPITLPPIIGKPPVTLPPIIGKPPITLPPIIGKPPITLPPVITNPPIITNPPTTNPPATGTPGCGQPSPAKQTCPVDTLRFGICLDILGNVVNIGDPAVNQCCPLIQGLTGIEAAICLCTTIKLKLLNINVLFPIAVDLLISCGKTPPPGYSCN